MLTNNIHDLKFHHAVLKFASCQVFSFANWHLFLCHIKTSFMHSNLYMNNLYHFLNYSAALNAVKEFSTATLFVETVVGYQVVVVRLHGNQYHVSLALDQKRIAKLLQIILKMKTRLCLLLSLIPTMIMILKVHI